MSGAFVIRGVSLVPVMVTATVVEVVGEACGVVAALLSVRVSV